VHACASRPPQPVHIAACWTGRYNAADESFGGIVAFNRADVERINGYPDNCPGLPGARAHNVCVVNRYCWRFVWARRALNGQKTAFSGPGSLGLGRGG
jgi:hypothetical protein